MESFDDPEPEKEPIDQELMERIEELVNSGALKEDIDAATGYDPDLAV